VIVAAGWLAGLTPAIGFKMMMIAITSCAVFITCLWLQRVTTPRIAFLAGLFIAASPEIVRLGREVLSDTPFWLFSMLALLAWDVATGKTADKTGSRVPMPLSWVILGSAATLAAYFTRSAGLPLLVATLAWLGFRRQSRAIAVLLALAVPLITAWWLRGQASGAGGYLAPFIAVDPYNPALGNVSITDLLERFIENLSNYTARELPQLVFGTSDRRMIAGVVLALGIIYGWIRRIKKPGVAELAVPLYLALILLWPDAWAGPRFLLPIAPVLALYVAEAVGAVSDRAKLPRVGPVAAGVAFAAAAGTATGHMVSDGELCREEYRSGDRFPCIDPPFHEFFHVAAESRGKLPQNSVVLSRKPTIFFLQSGYRSRLYPLSDQPDSLFRLAERTGAQFVLVDQIPDLAPLYLHQVMLARRDDFCVIPELSVESTVLVRIVRGAPARTGAAPNSFRTCPLNGP